MIETLVGTALVMWVICIAMAPAWLGSATSSDRSRLYDRSRLSWRSRLVFRSRVLLRSRLAFSKPRLSMVV
jgi:hypothetical protein